VDQAALVEAGDKPRFFLGGRAWIGSVEVALLLDIFCGATSRILTLRASADPSSGGCPARHGHILL